MCWLEQGWRACLVFRTVVPALSRSLAESPGGQILRGGHFTLAWGPLHPCLGATPPLPGGHSTKLSLVSPLHALVLPTAERLSLADVMLARPDFFKGF